MIQKMVVESWDGKSKIYAELDVVKKISEDVVLVRLWGENYKEFTHIKDQGFWKVTNDTPCFEGGVCEKNCNSSRGCSY